MMKQLRKKEEKALLIFLKKTKSGKYAKVDVHSQRYTRIKVQREDTYNEDEYYYTFR